MKVIGFILLLAILGPLAAAGLISAAQHHYWDFSAGWLSLGSMILALGCYRLGRAWNWLGTIFLIRALIGFGMLAH
jgi:hypothetical protein